MLRHDSLHMASIACPTILFIVPAMIMSAVVEAYPDNIAQGLYLLACGGLTGAYVLAWHRRINGSQIMFN
jgi:hypothetical protein